MLESGLQIAASAAEPAERAELRDVANAVAGATYHRWLFKRTPDDNRVEHDFVVFGAAMRIAQAERLPLAGKLPVVCVAFLHDPHPIPRILEREIRESVRED